MSLSPSVCVSTERRPNTVPAAGDHGTGDECPGTSHGYTHRTDDKARETDASLCSRTGALSGASQAPSVDKEKGGESLPAHT